MLASKHPKQLLAQHQSWWLLSPESALSSAHRLNKVWPQPTPQEASVTAGGKCDSSGDICASSGYKSWDNHYVDWRNSSNCQGSELFSSEAAVSWPLSAGISAFWYRRLMKQELGSLRARLSSPFKTAPIHHKPVSMSFFLVNPKPKWSHWLKLCSNCRLCLQIKNYLAW